MDSSIDPIDAKLQKANTIALVIVCLEALVFIILSMWSSKNNLHGYGIIFVILVMLGLLALHLLFFLSSFFFRKSWLHQLAKQSFILSLAGFVVMIIISMFIISNLGDPRND